ncbi:hypothetical protein N1851_021941 [Merluccius polli]|uniref:Uncharacterized protein n=1 Tax=Merluccius polli TaxID=89951 RepID=A0AA47MIU3_MERPO|nr:hypothetical protein N1851_021941 [Merluccius polli]
MSTAMQMILYISVEPTNPNSLCSLTTCLASVNQWMSDNFLKLNLGSLAHQTKSQGKSIGVILDSDLSFKPHISKVTQTALFHLRNAKAEARFELSAAPLLVPVSSDWLQAARQHEQYPMWAWAAV